jgi:hypothetical protein
MEVGDLSLVLRFIISVDGAFFLRHLLCAGRVLLLLLTSVTHLSLRYLRLLVVNLSLRRLLVLRLLLVVDLSLRCLLVYRLAHEGLRILLLCVRIHLQL